MKVILILAALVVVAVSRPAEGPVQGVVPILNYQLDSDEFGQYALRFIGGDGTEVEEQGALVPNAENTGFVLVKKGAFKYYSPDGTPIKESWVADANGFRAEGDHLPTTPAPLPVPSA